jgi:hypothetical protein
VGVPRKSPMCENGWDRDKTQQFAMLGKGTYDNKEVDMYNISSVGVKDMDLGCDLVLPVCSKKSSCELDRHRRSAEEKHEDCHDVEVCEPWPKFFQLPVLMLMLITLLNDGTLIAIGYDRVIASKTPERWNLRFVFTVSSVLGAVACGSSLLLLWAALDSNNPEGTFAGMGLPPLEYGQVITAIYLKVSISDFLTLFSARTQDDFFFKSMPGPILLGAASVSLIISTFLATFWPESVVDHLPVKGLGLGHSLMPLWVWIYCIIWWFIQDVAKVGTMFLLKYYKLFIPKVLDPQDWAVVGANRV